jgi:hypothetical protein
LGSFLPRSGLLEPQLAWDGEGHAAHGAGVIFVVRGSKVVLDSDLAELYREYWGHKNIKLLYEPEGSTTFRNVGWTMTEGCFYIFMYVPYSPREAGALA